MHVEGHERFIKGLKKLKEIYGKAGEKVIESLRNIAPDLGRYTIEYPFGDIYSRPGLDLKYWEIATVAALCAMGNAEPQLKVHINAALNVGCTPEEIVEVIIQMSVYAGFPAALNAASAAKTVFAERGITLNAQQIVDCPFFELMLVSAPYCGAPYVQRNIVFYSVTNCLFCGRKLRPIIYFTLDSLASTLALTVGCLLPKNDFTHWMTLRREKMAGALGLVLNMRPLTKVQTSLD